MGDSHWMLRAETGKHDGHDDTMRTMTFGWVTA